MGGGEVIVLEGSEWKSVMRGTISGRSASLPMRIYLSE